MVRDTTRESDARIVIDDLLRQAGWDPSDKSQVETEVTVSPVAAVAEGGAAYSGQAGEEVAVQSGSR